jgi:hypothetical protein
MTKINSRIAENSLEQMCGTLVRSSSKYFAKGQTS